jgi:hypothetical protein
MVIAIAATTILPPFILKQFYGWFNLICRKMIR